MDMARETNNGLAGFYKRPYGYASHMDTLGYLVCSRPLGGLMGHKDDRKICLNTIRCPFQTLSCFFLTELIRGMSGTGQRTTQSHEVHSVNDLSGTADSEGVAGIED